MNYKVGDLITYKNIYQVTGIGVSTSNREDDPHPTIQVKCLMDHPRRRFIDLIEEGSSIRRLQGSKHIERGYNNDVS